MSRKFEPASYQDWLNELNFSSNPEQMVIAAKEAAKRNPNRQKVKHDIALILAEMYRREMTKAADRPIVARVVREKFTTVTHNLFKQPIDHIVAYVINAEPNFDRQATAVKDGKTPPGNIDVKPQGKRDDQGREITPPGFVKGPRGRVTEEGKFEPGLGFLHGDPGGGLVI